MLSKLDFLGGGGKSFIEFPIWSQIWIYNAKKSGVFDYQATEYKTHILLTATP
jgi:hypothetical protein